MSCDKKDKNLKTCELGQFERNNYFYGKLMTVRDFEAEQDYFNNKRYLINRMIHGIGIVCGLKVDDSNSEAKKRPQNKNDSWSVYLNPGVALDCCGHEIVVNTGGLYTVKGTFSEKSNGLYLKYAECQKETVLGLSNLSNCEEECCPARIGETFTLEWGPLPELTEISGTVKEDKTLVSGALVEVIRNGTVIGSTVTDNKGKYYLRAELSSKEDKTPYIIRVSASNREVAEKELVFKDFAKKKIINLRRPSQAKDPAKLKKKIAQKYYEEHLIACPKCDDAKVLLAVFAEKNGSLEIKKETYEYREIVYNNPMLYNLLSNHITDFNNPHNVDAFQTGAMKGLCLKKFIEEDSSTICIDNINGYLTLEAGENMNIAQSSEDSNEIVFSSTAGFDPQLIGQLETVIRYIFEKALKCTVISFRTLEDKFQDLDDVKKMANIIWNISKEKLEDGRTCYDDALFLEAMKGNFIFSVYEEDILETFLADGKEDEFLKLIKEIFEYKEIPLDNPSYEKIKNKGQITDKENVYLITKQCNALNVNKKGMKKEESIVEYNSPEVLETFLSIARMDEGYLNKLKEWFATYTGEKLSNPEFIEKKESEWKISENNEVYIVRIEDNIIRVLKEFAVNEGLYMLLAEISDILPVELEGLSDYCESVRSLGVALGEGIALEGARVQDTVCFYVSLLKRPDR